MFYTEEERHLGFGRMNEMFGLVKYPIIVNRHFLITGLITKHKPRTWNIVICNDCAPGLRISLLVIEKTGSVE